MKNHNNINLIYFILPLVILIFLSIALETQALSCAPSPAKYIIICKAGVCQEGFEIAYKRYGEMCNTRPVVNEHPEGLQVLSAFIVKSTNIDISKDGIYKIDTDYNCSPPGYNFRLYQELQPIAEGDTETNTIINNILKGCGEASNVTKLSDDVSEATLQTYQTEWRVKEQAEYFQRVTKGLWGSIIFFSFLAFLAILWPWLILWRNPAKRKELPLLIWKAFYIQAILGIVLYFLLAVFFYSLRQTGVLLALIIITITMVFEFIYLVIYRKGKLIIQKLRK